MDYPFFIERSEGLKNKNHVIIFIITLIFKNVYVLGYSEC